MRSSVYINEAAPQAVTMDFSASPAELMYSDQCYGFAFMKAIEHLGLDAQVDPEPELYCRLRVEGSVESIKGHVPQLQRHIGLIARYGAELRGGTLPRFNRDWIGRTLGDLVQRKLPTLSEDTSLLYAMGIIVDPFVNMTNDDGARIYYGRYPGEGTERSIVKNEDGTPLGPYSARDIGGLLVGPDGLPAPEALDCRIGISEADLGQLKRIGRAKDTGTGKELGYSLRRFLERAVRPIISQVPVEDDMRNVMATFSRIDLEKAAAIELETGAGIADIIRTAVKSYIYECASDSELQEKIGAKKQR